MAVARRRFRDASGTIYYTIGNSPTRYREFHPRHERKRLGISHRQQKRMRMALLRAIAPARKSGNH
jgi:hypothetical protein